jgi:predicted transposase/invertase (TIGR01784 family)
VVRVKKGLEEGKKEGLEEGKKKGLEEGKKRAKIEIAKSLLEVLDIETISLKTGLTIEEIILLK